MGPGLKQTTLRFYKERLLRVLVHIQQHLDESLSLQDLAGMAGLAPYHFHHVFTGMIGEPLGSHIRRLRLERAALRLKSSRMPVLEIALEAGYETHEAFARAFHECFKTSPSEFRRRNGVVPWIRAQSSVHYRPASGLQTFRATQLSGGKTMKATIMQLKPIRVAFMRHVGPYGKVGATWEKVMMFLGKEGLVGGDALFIGICHDDPAVTRPAKLRYDACVTADDRFQPEGDIGVQLIPGGDYARTTHFGPYPKVGASYAWLLGKWIPRSGRTLRASPCFEAYLNSPEVTAPEDLITDLYAPLEPIPGMRP